MIESMFPTISGFVVPFVVKLIKSKVNWDVPVFWWVVVAGLNVLIVGALVAIFDPNMSNTTIFTNMLTSQIASQITHAITKTPKKVNGTQ